jgi:hypothetical protein
VIVAVSYATEVTRPVDDTVATDAADVVHVTVAPLITVSFASFTVAVTVAVSASDEKLRLVGDTVIDEATWATVTAAVALTEPEVAVITAVPSATEVTRPADETVAIVVSDVAHVTVAPLISLPLSSLTTAVSVAVSPNDGNVSSVSDNSMLVAV